MIVTRLLAPTRRSRLRLMAAAAICLIATALQAAPATNPPQQLHALLDEDWAWTLQHEPEFATYYGEHRYDDRLRDDSPAGVAEREAHARQMLARISRISREGLQGEDRVSYDVYLHQVREQVEAQRFPVLRTRVLSANSGIHIDFGQLLQAMPMRDERDARQMVARIVAFPARVAQDIAWLREGKRLGWVTHRASLERVREQLDQELVDDPSRSPFIEPFKALPAGMSSDARQAVMASAQAAVRAHVNPALRELRRVVVEELLPASPESGALSAYPGGAPVYEFQVRRHTTTTLGASAIHEIGLREVARLRAAMEKVMADSGFKGSFADYVHRLNTDPAYFHKSGEDLLRGYRDIAKRVDPELPKLFAELPRLPYGVRAIAAYEGAGTPEYYSPGSADGSRPGWFNANVVALGLRPTWDMEVLFLHEAVPGHHLQSSRALELHTLPPFRRAHWIVAYGEGWALYAEGLGHDLGLYKSPESQFGQLRSEIWRAARLVVDTGIHALGWSRQQAIDWMTERTGIARDDVTAEVDRYYAWPAQALGYKIGQLKILALRDKARAALGERFDIRRFHMVVLDHGAVPLPVLESLVDEWIAREKGGAH